MLISQPAACICSRESIGVLNSIDNVDSASKRHTALVISILQWRRFLTWRFDLDKNNTSARQCHKAIGNAAPAGADKLLAQASQILDALNQCGFYDFLTHGRPPDRAGHHAPFRCTARSRCRRGTCRAASSVASTHPTLEPCWCCARTECAHLIGRGWSNRT